MFEGQFFPGQAVQFEDGGPRNPWHRKNFKQIIDGLGIGSGLRICLDAGDISSWPGSGQKWIDLSGGGFDFFRGSSGTATTDDPTFNGTAGGLSSGEYWSFDGGDGFTYDTTRETWMDNFHKNDARYTVAFWLYFTDAVGVQNIMATTSNSNGDNVGMSWHVDGLSQLAMKCGDGSSPPSAQIGYGTVTDSKWWFLAISHDEANSYWRALRDNNVQALSVSYSGPSASAATSNLTIGSNAGGNLKSGTRIAMACVWEGSHLTEADLLAFYNATRGRFA